MRRGRLVIMALALGSVALVGSAGGAARRARAKTLTLDALPEAIRATVRREAKGAGIGKIQTVYRVELVVVEDDEEETIMLLVDAAGRLLRREPEEEVAAEDLPPAARAAIRKEAKGDEIEEVVRCVERGQTSYVVLFGNERELSFSVDAEGKVVGIEGEIEFQHVPAAVRAALRKRARGADIDTLERETEEGRTVYRGTFELNEREIFFEIDEKGNVLEWEVEEEDEDEDEDENEDEGRAPEPADPPARQLLVLCLRIDDVIDVILSGHPLYGG